MIFCYGSLSGLKQMTIILVLQVVKISSDRWYALPEATYGYCVVKPGLGTEFAGPPAPSPAHSAGHVVRCG